MSNHIHCDFCHIVKPFLTDCNCDSLLRSEIDDLEKTILVLEYIFRDEIDKIGYEDLLFKIGIIKSNFLVTGEGDWYIRGDAEKLDLKNVLLPNRKYR